MVSHSSLAISTPGALFQLLSSLIAGLASLAASLLAQPLALLLWHSLMSKTALGTVHKLLGFRSHRLATPGEEILWLGLNKLVQLLKALWLLVA